jgi:hypothetical protein
LEWTEKRLHGEEKECKRNGLRVKAGKRAAKFEEKWMDGKSVGEKRKEYGKEKRVDQ